MTYVYISTRYALCVRDYMKGAFGLWTSMGQQTSGLSEPQSVCSSQLSTTLKNAHQTSCFCQRNCTNASRAGPWDPILSWAEFSCRISYDYLMRCSCPLINLNHLGPTGYYKHQTNPASQQWKNKHPRIIPHLEGCNVLSESPSKNQSNVRMFIESIRLSSASKPWTPSLETQRALW